ncbi:golgin subfamily A member 6-like protein 22 [Eurytemora carolleeae]|uniref:golgin subfamily A member 6-like protein 22 n=1 Tax=Eurytemora carolleeae TaxID=1294199 RepID=UPI000C774879|nr:golgin subfamily A member 6-like protein 22 [Eurytemora carolleeae]|eukprot:XP_023323249.1 golgin subfamily A member 6-like protein 22 [Eurytemora affinis]
MYRNLDKEHSKLAGQAKEMAWKMKKMETELKDARDTSDLLEFRLLELEQRESRERTPELGRKEEKDSISIHSGNVDSGCSSQTTLEDIIETHRDFRNEKIQDTKLKLHELMKHIPEPGGKSLLLQTVALFETLLARIKLMKEENQELQGEKMNLEKIKKDQDDLLSSMSKEQQREESRAIQAELELRNTCEEVEELKVRLITTQQQLEQSRMERDKLHTVKKQIEERQDKICSDLRRENDQSLQKLEIERQGFKAEQQMYQDVLERYSHQERIIKEQHSRLDEQENRMKEQEVKKIEEGGYRKGNRRESVESGDFNSKVSSKETSSGVSSDISDSESSDLDLHHLHHHSQRLYQQKVDYKEAEEQMEESGIFEQTSDSSLLLESNTEKSLLRKQEEKKEKKEKEEKEEREEEKEEEEEKVQDGMKGRNIVELELEINNFSRLEPQIDEDREEEYNEQLSDRSSQQKSSLDKFGSCEELKRINSTRYISMVKILYIRSENYQKWAIRA